MSWQVLAVFGIAVLWFALRRHRKGRVRTPGRRLGRKSTVMLMVAGILGIQSIIGVPAFADQCGQPPPPEQMDEGMVGAIDAHNSGEFTHGTQPGPGQNWQDPQFNYYEYGYSGTTWHVYQDNCGVAATFTDPNSVIDTWAGNQLFNVGKNIVGATNALHYAMLSQQGLFGQFDSAIQKAAQTFYNNVYVRWFGPVALVLAILLFRQIWKGDLAGISKRGMWAMAGMWLAASVLVLGPLYSEIDTLFLQKTAEIQTGFNFTPQSDPNDVLPEELYNHVVYMNWQRGEFGDPTSATAKQYSQELLEDQAISTTENTAAMQKGGDLSQLVAAKQNDFKTLPGKLGNDAGFMEGTQGSRTGDGFLAMFQAVAYSLFQLFAKAAILLAQLLLRLLLLAGPLIGLAAMLMPDLLPRIGRAAGAILFNVLMLCALAGMQALLLNLIFGATALPLIAQIVLAGLITVVFFMLGKPTRRMWQMVELSMAAVGVGMPSGSLMSRMRRKRGKEQSPQEQFWDTVRNGDDSDTELSRTEQRSRRVRPEATTVMATAQRMDRRPRSRELPGAPGAAPSYALPGGPSGYTGPSTVVPEAGSSRVVDTPSVVDAAWDRGEDAFVVPSRVSRSRQNVPGPRRAETEMVQGRPVFVLYRPSRGLEVRDADWDNTGQSGRTMTR